MVTCCPFTQGRGLGRVDLQTIHACLSRGSLFVMESDGFSQPVIRTSHGHFAPGTVGGPGRMPKGLSVTEKIKRRMLQESDAIAERVVQALIDESKELNVRLLDMTLQRIEGVPKQVLQLEGAEDSPYSFIMQALAARMGQIAEAQGAYGSPNDSPTHPDAPQITGPE